MRIAVTGSSGFIGTHLTTALKGINGVEIIPLDKVSGLDLTLDESLSAVSEFDVLISLASLLFIPSSFLKAKEFYRTNFLLTLNALELCKKYNAKIVHLSSYVYGEPVYQPTDEKHPLKADNPYIRTKLISEQLCEGYSRDFGVKCTVLRPFNIYGPGQSSNFLIASIIDQIKQGRKTIELQNPHPRRDFVYVEDLCDAIIRSVQNDRSTGETYNVASGISYSVEEVAHTIIELAGDPALTAHFDPEAHRRSEVMEVCGSYAKINEHLQWTPSTSLRSGLEQTIRRELNSGETR